MKKLMMIVIPLFALLVTGNAIFGQTRDEKVRADRQKVRKVPGWTYDDLEQGIEIARKNNQPLMVVLRCIP